MQRRPPFLIGLIIIGLILAFGGVRQWTSAPVGPPARTGDVITGRARVVDGDSLEVSGHRIRLFGVDAPESRQDCRDAQGRSYACGREARDSLAAAIGGQSVSCTPVGQSYDRDVSVCTANGRDLSEAMVRTGHALELRQHSRGRYSDAEREARNARRGLWAGDFERPSQWRQQHPR
ncbi:MAG: thermonuclease family protein [Alphaproteobacteria bacterium]|nr:thermonuclease family protein [Alphaproteobacteria bacterium]